MTEVEEDLRRRLALAERCADLLREENSELHWRLHRSNDENAQLRYKLDEFYTERQRREQYEYELHRYRPLMNENAKANKVDVKMEEILKGL